MTGPPSPADVQAAFCATLCDEWARAGVTDAVVSPGSRSTPVVIALDADERIRTHVVLDERSAGFVALGLGLSSRRPAVVVTTSGTAAVELHPAMVEAWHSRVPLIAVTSDRPPELQHIGAPQTVDQVGLYGRSVVAAFDPGVPSAESMGSWRSLAARVAAEAVAGPVHLNLAFREPLLGDPEAVTPPPARPGGLAWHRHSRPVPSADPALVTLLRSHAGRRGLIVAGEGAGPAGPVLDLAGRLAWPVLADPRSGCRVESPRVISTADLLLRVPRFAGEWPEAVLHIGAPWASKVLNAWVESLPPEVPQAFVDPKGRWLDPGRRAGLMVGGAVAQLVEALSDLSPLASPWVDRWVAAERAARAAIDALLSGGGGDPDGGLALSEPGVARACVRACRTVVVSSSMPVRDVEWFAPPAPGSRVFSNRGANGIDGVLSTAVGVALARPGEPVLALIGDLAFVYDAGALLWAGGRDLNLSVLVVDNGGGGIFSFLPQAGALDPARFERYWGTPHGLDLVKLAGAYGVPARAIDTPEELAGFLSPRSLAAAGVRVGVVSSDRAANVAAHDRLYQAVAEAVAHI